MIHSRSGSSQGKLLPVFCRQCSYSGFSVSKLGKKMSTEGISAHRTEVYSILALLLKFNFSLGNGCSLGNGYGNLISRYPCVMCELPTV